MKFHFPSQFHFAATLLVFFLLTGCSESSRPLTPGITASIGELKTVLASKQIVTEELSLDGTVEAVNRATVSAQTAGRVTELPYDVGDYIAKGDVIAKITANEQNAGVKAAEAQLKEANAVFAEADAQLKRMKNVYEQGVVSKSQYDQALAAQQSAAARVESAKAALADARQRLEYTTVVAPYSGVMVSRLIDVGATVTVGTPLLEGVSLNDLRVRVDIPQQYILPIRQQEQARVILDNGNTIQAEQLRISPSANPQTQSFNTLVELPNDQQESALYPGTLVKVAFALGDTTHITVPDSAIARRGEVNGVYVIKENSLRFQYVRLGRSLTNGNTVVLSGVLDGDTVAADVIAAAASYKKQHFVKQG
ncbi:efflux RND transporter periplasmic adaptor subunit [Alteromonas sp. D210916BOD_24]|uniref:efflux RND transporter periplasmic adaptor subunit n=1 Tax=Alteromonas sp. D210916BOD_24 TaxID=3157618 RepID=UPI00399C5EAA